MPKLIVKRGTSVLGEVSLDAGKNSFEIGSDPDCDYGINDEAVASKHLEIQKIDGDYFLFNLAKDSKTNVNGLLLTHELRLADGDEISIGELGFTFENTAAAPSLEDRPSTEISLLSDNYTPPPATEETIEAVTEDTMQLKVPSATAEVERSDSIEFGELDQVTGEFSIPSGEHEPLADDKEYCLHAIHGPYLGATYPLKFGETKIGRDQTLNDVVIREDSKGELDPSISRRHATISYRDGLFYVSDKRSKTRTYVNQTKLDVSDEALLGEGDEIEIVSDRKSTILRMTSRSQPDLSPPKKAGVWWIRNSLRLGMWLSAILGLAAVASFAFSFLSRQEINKKPELLTFVEDLWLQSQKPDDQNVFAFQGRDLAFPNLALADVDGDRDVDVVLTDAAGLRVLDGRSKEILWDLEGVHPLQDIPVVLSDLNLNGLKDILVVGQDTRLRAIDGRMGAEIWLSPILGQRISGPPGVADLNGDGLKDFFICTTEGQLHFGYSQVNAINWVTIETGKVIRSTPSSGDWDGDGFPEVFVGSEDGHVIIINGQFAKIEDTISFSEKVGPIVNQERRHSIRYPIAISDLNQDELGELIIGSTSGVYLALDILSRSQIWVEALHRKASRFDQHLAPAIGDCDGDGISDAAIVSNQVIKVIRGGNKLGSSQRVLWEFAINDDLFSTPITLADFNKDGARDVIIGSRKGSVTILDGRTGEQLSKIKNDWNAITSPLLVADLSGNGFLDVAYLREDHAIYIIESNSMIGENSVVWGQYHGDERHLGQYAYVGPSPKLSDLVTSVSGLLFVALAVITVAARQRRFRMIHRNRMS